MTCDDFRNNIDSMADLRQAINRDDLSSEMLSHLHECPICARYFDSVTTTQQILGNMQSDEIPNELRHRLMGFGNEHRRNPVASSMPLMIYILRILLPAMFVWMISLFTPAAVRVVVEVVLMIFAMTLAFEKIGKRLVTDRV